MTEPTQGETRELIEVMKELVPLLSKAVSMPQPQASAVGEVHNIMMAPPTNDERAVHRVEKKHAQMVVLNIVMGVALVLNWFTDTNQSYVINAIYMMAPGLQQQIEAQKAATK